MGRIVALGRAIATGDACEAGAGGFGIAAAGTGFNCAGDGALATAGEFTGAAVIAATGAELASDAGGLGIG
jgi:hypothetical protein